MSQEDLDLYYAACHAMQSGVKFSKNPNERDPKHLRVGINSAYASLGGLVQILMDKGILDTASTKPEDIRSTINAWMSDHGGLCNLLMEKGVFTRDEFEKALRVAMEQERDAYAEQIAHENGAAPGVKITLM